MTIPTHLRHLRGQPAQQLTPPEPLVTAWPACEVVAATDGSGAWVLEAGGRTYLLPWRHDGSLREIAPPLPWLRPQEVGTRTPHRHEGEGRLIALADGCVLRFVSTGARHVRTPCSALLQVFDASGSLLREREVRGVMPRLLAADGEGSMALVGCPGRWVADPWRVVEVSLTPVEARRSTGEAPLELPSAPATTLDASQGTISARGERWLLARNAHLTLVTRGLAEPWQPEGLGQVSHWTHLALAPDGELAVLGDDRGRLALARCGDHRVLWVSLVPGRSPVLAAQPCADGTVVAITADGKVHGFSREGSPALLADLAGTLPEPRLASCAALDLEGRQLLLACSRTLVSGPIGNRPLEGAREAPRSTDEPPHEVGQGASAREQTPLPPPLTTHDGRWNLRCSASWEMVDAYQSDDVWQVEVSLAPPDPASHVPQGRLIRLPEQPRAWGPEAVAGVVLVESIRGTWMALHLDRLVAYPLSRPGESKRVALCGARCIRRGETRGSSERPATLEVLDLATLEVVRSVPCAAADSPLAASPDSLLVLLQDGPGLRVLHTGDASTRYEARFEGDEALEAHFEAGRGFHVVTRRGATVLIALEGLLPSRDPAPQASSLPR